MLSETFAGRHDQRESPVGVANWLRRRVLVWRNNITVCGAICNRVIKFLYT